MFCSNCGKEVADNAVVCMNCGCLVEGAHIEQSCVQRQPQKNGMAIAGFVCSFFIPILGWVFGGIGLSRSQKREGKGKGFSIAAIVISTVTFIYNFALIA